MIVRLSPFELMWVASVGVSRNVSAIRDSRQLEAGRTDLGWEHHIVGAIGEFAASVALDVPWRPAVGRLDTRAGDVAGCQVRATARPDGCLIVKEEDPADDFLLVVVSWQEANVVGWFPAVEARQPHYWRTAGLHRPAWLVPQEDLWELELLWAREAA